MDLDHIEIKWVGVDWINLAQNGDQRLFVLNTLWNLRVPQNAENFLSSWGTVTFSKGLCTIESFSWLADWLVG